MQPDQPAYEESKLTALLAQDSEYAFQLLFDRYRNPIYRLALRYLKSPILAQEIVQDVFLKLWFERKNLHTNKPIEPWLFRVAKNHIINHLEKLSREWSALHHIERSTESAAQNIYDHLQDAHYQKLLREAIVTLPEKQRQVFELARHHNLSYLQIAEKLQISSLTVKTHMSRALQHIRGFFNQEGIIFLLCLLSATFF
ncbi:MAG TPA: RNA polymerase sigma-70 factor [Chitinophagaceae bacterium]|nr:RNA polymerase sigma-70 factor [Chitinophagaceae bacterium]